MKKILIGIFALLALTFASKVFADPPADKVKICHRTDSNTNPYVSETVDVSSVDGNSGNDNGKGDHYLDHTGPVWYSGISVKWGDIIPPIAGSHNGLNWTSQGRTIYNNDCKIPPACSPAEQCPTTCHTDTITVCDGKCGRTSCPPNPLPADVCPTRCGYQGGTVPDGKCGSVICNATQACPTSSPSPTVSPTPSSTPIPTATPIPGLGKQSKTAITDPVCVGQNFDAKIQLSLDGNPIKDVNVKFVYSNEAKYAKTGTDGWAGVAYGYKDETNVEFIPEQGYPTQLQKVVKSQNCVTPVVLGVSITSGKVLGATTLGKTGAFEDTLMNMVGWMGASLTAAGSFLYAKKKN